MEEGDNNKWKSKSLTRCEGVYNELLKNSRDTIDGIIWEGQLVSIVQPFGNYTSIVGALKDMGCIEQIRRGGGPTASVWRLITPPTVELLYKVSKRAAPNSAKTAKSALQAVTVLEDRVSELEKKLTLLIKAVEPIVKANQPQG